MDRLFSSSRKEVFNGIECTGINFFRSLIEKEEMQPSAVLVVALGERIGGDGFR